MKHYKPEELKEPLLPELDVYLEHSREERNALIDELRERNLKISISEIAKEASFIILLLVFLYFLAGLS